ncbi:MAG: uroporphyrinogen-III C-methyltransferase [Oscillospiraceae bacterium]
MKEKTGCVYLVGAGCGDAGLITVCGQELLRHCDTVVYDSLISPELLGLLKPEAERIYMGKRQGRHSASQEEICAQLIAKAREGKCVVRLKGGDPFVFGRGGEELMALINAGIPCEEIPGITSAIAIPAAAGIPVTHRGLSRGVHIVAVHTADTADGLPEDFDDLARLKGTLVLLMGLSRLELISARLISAGMDSCTPAAVISGGNSPNPATVRGTLGDIASITRAADVRSPAVIVVGKVAELELTASISRPLSGIRIGVTGTDNLTGKLSAKLRELGAYVFTAQRSVVEELACDIERLLDGRTRWLVFTSSNGVRVFFSRLKNLNIDIRRLSACKFAVIGSATAKTLGQYGICADICPQVFTSEALGAELIKSVPPGEPIALLRSRLGSEPLLSALVSAGLSAEDIPLYTVNPVRSGFEERLSEVKSADYLVFGSSGGVGAFFEEFGDIPDGPLCVCIGDVTASSLKKMTTRSFITASRFTSEGIAEAILCHHSENGSK